MITPLSCSAPLTLSISTTTSLNELYVRIPVAVLPVHRSDVLCVRFLGLALRKFLVGFGLSRQCRPHPGNHINVKWFKALLWCWVS